MNTKIATLVLLYLGLATGTAWASLNQKDIEKFKHYNASGPKYEFVKNYLTSLNYLRFNANRQERMPPVRLDDLAAAKRIVSLKNDLIADNANLRVARNLLKKFHVPDNGLILKATDLFIRVCDDQIGFNNQEKELLDQIHDLQISGGVGPSDKDKYGQQFKVLAAQRKESLKNLLEASMLIGKILVSAQTDTQGELTTLDITKKERQKLLLKVKECFGDLGRSGVQPGQTFLEGSVGAIREILEDSSWSAIDG